MPLAAEDFFALPPDPRVSERCARGSTAEGVLAGLLWRKVRLAHLDAERRALVESRVRAAVDAGEPVRLLDEVGGFKGPRASAAPGVGWGEVFHLSFVRSWLLPIVERYPPGVVLEYAGQGEVATWVDNVPEESVRTYAREFEALLAALRATLPGNLVVRTRPLGDAYELGELGERFATWEREEIPADRAAEVDARVDRAAHNFVWRGARDLSTRDEGERRVRLRRSVWMLLRFYEHDARARRAYFEGGVPLTHGPGFAGTYAVRDLEGSDKTFWMAEGALVGTEVHDRKVLLMPDDRAFRRVQWRDCTGRLRAVAPALGAIPCLEELPPASERPDLHA